MKIYSLQDNKYLKGLYKLEGLKIETVDLIQTKIYPLRDNKWRFTHYETTHT